MNAKTLEAYRELKQFQKKAEQMYAKFDNFVPTSPTDRKVEMEDLVMDIKNHMFEFMICDAWGVLEEHAPDKAMQMETIYVQLSLRQDNLSDELNRKYTKQVRHSIPLAKIGIHIFA